MSTVDLLTNFSFGYYKDNIGDLYPGSPADPLASYFPGPNVSTGDPRVNFSSAPAFHPLINFILGSWLSDAGNAISNNSWGSLQSIPRTWTVNAETAIIYQIDGSLTGQNPLQGRFGADNGIFVWVNGEYKFGALAPGVATPGEYTVNLGILKPGKNYIQILREDHGVTNGSDIRITGEVEPGIFIESSPVTFGFGYDHLYLVYKDVDGKETILSAGQTIDTGSLGVRGTGKPLLIENSSEKRLNETLVDRGSRRLDLGGRNPKEVWEMMRQQARNINAAELPYAALIDAQNSNSAVASLLHSVGININKNIPLNTKASDLPGIENLLMLPVMMQGSAADDILYGGAGNSELFGKAGRDILVGEGGNDILNGGSGNDRTNGGSGRNKVLLGPGRDIHELTKGAGVDIIQDFRDRQDKLALPSNLKIGKMEFIQRGRDTLIKQNADLLAVLNGVEFDLITASDFVR
jgi:hypothetical protein